MTPLQQQWQYYIQQSGMDPSYAMAVLSRESGFNPNMGGTGTIGGGYQMTRRLRREYGIPEPTIDARGRQQHPPMEAQTRGFAAYTKDLTADMRARLKRDPTGAELYLGHHFGPYRAAGMITGQIPADTPVENVFSPREMRGNPHFARAGTTGNLASSILTDMHRRMGQFGAPRPPADIPEAAMAGIPGNAQPTQATAPHSDFSEFGGPTPSGTPQPAPQWPAVPGTQLDPAWSKPEGSPQDVVGDLVKSALPTQATPAEKVPTPRPRPPAWKLSDASEGTHDFSEFGGQDVGHNDFSEFGAPQKTSALEPNLGNPADDATRGVRKDEMDIKRDRNERSPLQMPDLPFAPTKPQGPTQFGALSPDIFGVGPDAMVA